MVKGWVDRKQDFERDAVNIDAKVKGMAMEMGD